MLGLYPPSIRTSHSIDLDNVRSNLSKGAGGALSPVGILSPSGQRTGSGAFSTDAEKLRQLLAGSDGMSRLASQADRLLESLERTRDWAAQVPRAGQGEASSARQPTGRGDGSPVEAEVGEGSRSEAAAEQLNAEVSRALYREASDMQPHFSKETWKVLAAAESAAAAVADDAARLSPASAPPTLEASQSQAQHRPPPPPATEPPVQQPSRSTSPAPNAAGSAAVPLLLTEEVLSKLSLPPAVLRKAQQLPGLIPLPDGQDIQLVGRALLAPGVDHRVVVVRDDEPTSLVAHALSSEEYMQFLADIREHILHGKPKPNGQLPPLSRSSVGNCSSSDIAAADVAGNNNSNGKEEPGHVQQPSTPVDGESAAEGLRDAKPQQSSEGHHKGNKGTLTHCNNSGNGQHWQPEGGVDFRVLMWHGRTHFEHTVMDDPPVSGSGARLSVRSYAAWASYI